MKEIIRYSLGGLSRDYYFRQVFFGALIAAVFIAMGTRMPIFSPSMVAFAVVSTLAYPYSRFVYESIVNFIMGDTILVSGALLFMIWKVTAMLICWTWAVLIAPVGLIYLYFHHRKNSTEES